MNKLTKVYNKFKSFLLNELVIELKWILKTVSPYRKQIALYFILTMITALVSLFFTFKTKNFFDYLVNKEWGKVISLGLYCAVFTLMNVILEIISQRYKTYALCTAQMNLRVKTFSQVIKSKWETASSFHSGDLITRINEDIKIIAQSVTGWLPDIFFNLTKIVCLVAIVIYYDFFLALVLLVIIPLIYFTSKGLLKKIYNKNKEERVISSTIMEIQKEALNNIHTIKAFGLENKFIKRLSDAEKNSMEVNMKNNEYSVISWAIMYVSGHFVLVLCLVLCLYHVYKGYITLGTLTMIGIVASRLAMCFKSIVNIIPECLKTLSSSERIRTLLMLHNDKEEALDQDTLIKAYNYGLDIEGKDISFSYIEDRKIFDKVSFEAMRGDVVAFVGPSGEGKTTMLRLLMGIINNDSGFLTYKVGEQLIEQNKIKSLISYVPQGCTMLSMSIKDNMRLVKEDATDEEIIEALKMSCAWDFVQKLPDTIDYIIGENGKGFSEGQNQRLSIARALLCNAPLLLLDEATSALDVDTERKVLRNIMKQNKNTTCILTTHRPSVLSLCNRVYRIENQKVRIQGEAEITKMINDF